MTVDGVGGIWRYGVDLARSLNERLGISCLLAGFGPRPAAVPAGLELVWTDAPLDWMASRAGGLAEVPELLDGLARRSGAELLHLNLPSQAAGLASGWPVVCVSHSCVPTWWRAVRGTALPDDWEWHQACNRQGLLRAQQVLAPSGSHLRAMLECYAPLPAHALRVVPNASALAGRDAGKEPMILAAGRWWDEGKNGAVLDRAAARLDWPVLLAGATEGPSGQAMRPRHARGLGPLGQQALTGLMARAAIFAAPSLYEPFGLAVLEAARQHAALVLADIPSFRELWDGAAVFVPARDDRLWSQALAELAADPARRASLAREAAARAAAFTPAAQLDGVARAYGRAMAAARN